MDPMNDLITRMSALGNTQIPLISTFIPQVSPPEEIPFDIRGSKPPRPDIVEYRSYVVASFGEEAKQFMASLGSSPTPDMILKAMHYLMSYPSGLQQILKPFIQHHLDFYLQQIPWRSGLGHRPQRYFPSCGWNEYTLTLPTILTILNYYLSEEAIKNITWIRKRFLVRLLNMHPVGKQLIQHMKDHVPYAQNVLRGGGLRDSPKHVTLQMMRDIIHNLTIKHQEEVKHHQMMASMEASMGKIRI